MKRNLKKAFAQLVNHLANGVVTAINDYKSKPNRYDNFLDFSPYEENISEYGAYHSDLFSKELLAFMADNNLKGMVEQRINAISDKYHVSFGHGFEVWHVYLMPKS